MIKIIGVDLISWLALVFPLWTLLVSVYILIHNLHRKAAPEAA